MLSNPKDEAGEVSIPIGKYVMEKSEEIAKPTVRLETDNKFVFNYSALSSYYATGSYQIDNDNALILKTDDGNFQYIFKIKEKTLIFDSKESAEMPSYANIPDGSIFKLTNSNIIKNDSVTVEDYANQYIKEIIERYENPTGHDGGFEIIDSKITKLEKLETFDDILATPVEVWSLEYRLKPDDINKVVIAGGMEEEGGWLTENSSIGKPFLAFSLENNSRKYLGVFHPQLFGFDTLAKQETALRIMLERKDLLANVTYPGDHVLVKFPLSTGETSQLLLSQPVKQGDEGIWVVERWMDGNGSIYYEFPETDTRIMDYYKEQQRQFNNGENLYLGNPSEVSYDFIINNLGQTLVDKDDLVIIDPATVEDFMVTPISHYMGYLSKSSFDDLIHIDRIEFLGSGDEERMKELNIDPDSLPNGFYIHNPNSYPDALSLSENTEYKILNWEDLSNHKNITKEEFMKFLEGDNPYNSTENLLFHVYTKDGYATELIEQYIP